MLGNPRNAAERRGGIAMGQDGRDASRITTTLTRLQRTEVARIAKQHGVKEAWLVRHAVQRLIDEANRGTLPLDFSQGDAHE